MSIRGLLFQWTTTKNIQLRGLHHSLTHSLTHSLKLVYYNVLAEKNIRLFWGPSYIICPIFITRTSLEGKYHSDIGNISKSLLCCLGPFSLPTPYDFSIILLSNVLTISVLYECYSKYASSTLNKISTYVLLSHDRYLCWWTICPRLYHPPNSLCFGI
jgi:hypothetical protein